MSYLSHLKYVSLNKYDYLGKNKNCSGACHRDDSRHLFTADGFVNLILIVGSLLAN